jgi:hypothetical protein
MNTVATVYRTRGVSRLQEIPPTTQVLPRGQIPPADSQPARPVQGL